MAIPASHIVKVFPRVITPGSDDLEFNGLILSLSDLIPADKVLSFPSPRAVMDFFGADSGEYEMSRVYFQSYDNKFTAPRALLFARRLATDAPGKVVGAPLTATLTDLKAVTAGSLLVRVGATEDTVTGLSLATATSLSDVASKLQTALVAESLPVTVVYSSLTRGFIVTAATAGEGTDVTFDLDQTTGGIELGRLLGLRTDAGAVESPGMDGQGVQDRMSQILDQTQNWVGLTQVYPAPEAEVLDLAEWASRNYGYLYVPWSMDVGLTLQTVTTDLASQLKDLERDHVAMVYGRASHAAFILGGVASVPWLRLNGAITLAFKHQTGLEATVSNETVATVLESKSCNYHGNFATRNADFRFLYPGLLSFSAYRFIDSYINSVWLNSMLQRSLMDGLARSGRVPYTPRGYTMIRAWMMDPVLAATNNGVIEKDVVLNESQKAELVTEAGRDISPELRNYGYVIQILDPGAEARYARETPIINLWYTYGGSVQRIEVASTAVL
jgi:hypothetical protein